jgi:hypothetical protein
MLAALSASLALADDFKTINGKEYKNVTVSGVEPDGIVLRSKSGITKVYFTELPKEVQERFLPSPAETPAAQRVLIELKRRAAAIANPASFALFFVGGASLVAAGMFAFLGRGVHMTSKAIPPRRRQANRRGRKRELDI